MLRRTYEAFGQPFAIEADGSMGELLDDVLGDLAAPPAPGPLIVVRERARGEFDVDIDGSVETEHATAAEAVHGALIAVNGLAGTTAARDMAVLHGGVVAWDGRAVAFVGHSGSGKTTFTAAAVRAGGAYVADEVCALDDAGQVHPYHRPLGLRRSGALHLGIEAPDDPRFARVFPWRVRPPATRSGIVPLVVVMLLERREGPAEVVRLAPGEALARLADYTLGDDGIEREMFKRLDRLVREIPVCTLRYGDCVDAVPIVRAMIGTASD